MRLVGLYELELKVLRAVLATCVIPATLCPALVRLQFLCMSLSLS